MQQNVQSAMSPEIIEKIQTAGVVAVLVIDQLQHTIPLANALLAGGIDAIELTLRTPVALDAAKVIKAELPQITLGLGNCNHRGPGARSRWMLGQILPWPRDAILTVIAAAKEPRPVLCSGRGNTLGY
jgi:hypothetical protein